MFLGGCCADADADEYAGNLSSTQTKSEHKKEWYSVLYMV